MKNSFSLSYVYQIISKSEFEFKEDIIKYGEESWPLTRNMLWVTLTNFKKENKFKKDRPNFFLRFRRLSYKKFKKILINSYKNIFYNFSKKKFFKNSSIIFFSRSVYLEKLSSGFLFDRIIDPIFMTSKVNNNTIKVYIDNPILKDIFFLDGLNYFSDIFIFKRRIDPLEYKKLEQSGIMFLKLFIELNNLNGIEDFLILELKKSIRNYLISKYKSKEFLSKFDSLEKIFLTSWYFPDMMGIIASAKILKIPTIEVQHGKQGKFQAGYSGWNYFPLNGFLNMPDNFWCWGEKSIENILKASPKRKFHKPFLGGYAWPIWYKTFAKKRTYEEEINPIKIKLLFTIQGQQQFTNNEPLPESILELIKHYTNIYERTNNDLFELRIRLHPNNLSQDIAYLKDRLGELFYSDLLSYSSKLKCCLYDDLIWANHHITFYSSCAIEALIFGIKSAVYGNEAYKIYEEEIENKSITFLKNNSADEIIKWIDNEIFPSKNSYKNLIESIFPDPNLINSL